MDSITNERQPGDEAAVGVTVVKGKQYMSDAKGSLVPIENVKAEHKLEDEVVRKIIAFAEELSAQVSRFRSHTMRDLGEFDALLAQEYGAKIGGAKGNRTYFSFDGLLKVQVAISDFVDFGPQLQIAKKLLDECLMEWSADSRPEIRAVITKAFNTEREGQVNRSEIFMLLRLDIDDPRWQEAMRAIRDAMLITSSKEYVRFYRRGSIDEKFQNITIDLAKV
jgi:hypothetical protein